MIKIAIVGAGLAAECFKHYFFNFINESKIGLQIDQFSSPLAPATTSTTTSVIAKRGMERGVSDLGDLLLDAYDEWESFYKSNKNIQGVSKEQFVHRVSKDSDNKDQFLKRFNKFEIVDNAHYIDVHENGYLVDNDIFFDWLKVDQKLKCRQVDQLVTAKDLANYDFVFYFTGAIGFNFQLTGKKEINQCQQVQGSYLILENHSFQQWFNQHNVFEIDGVNLINRPSSKQLIIGATSNHWETQYLPDLVKLKQQYLTVKRYFELPAFDTFKIKTGLRLKGKKRIPYIGVGDQENSFVVNALYKNGYTVAYLGAQRAVEYFKTFLEG